MTFNDYTKLKEKAKENNIEDSPSLKQLLHILQVHNVVKEYYAKFNAHMNTWEDNCKKSFEEELKEKKEDEDMKNCTLCYNGTSKIMYISTMNMLSKYGYYDIGAMESESINYCPKCGRKMPEKRDIRKGDVLLSSDVE